MNCNKSFTPSPSWLVTILANAIFFSGCFSSSPTEEYFYQLHTPAAAMEKGRGPKLLLADFMTASGYDTTRIAYRVSPNEIRYYAHRQWTAEPSRLIGEASVRHLRASGLFSEVARGEKIREPHAVLEGYVEAIEETDKDDDAWQARLAMTFILRAPDSEKILMRHSFDVTRPCKRPELQEVAAGVSSILEDELQKMGPYLLRAIPR